MEAAASSAVAHAESVVDLHGPYDLPRSLGVLQRGHADPTIRVDPGSFPGGRRGTPGAGAWLAQRIYADDGAELGQATYRFDQLGTSTVRVRTAASSQETAQLALQRAALILGAADDWQELEFLLDAMGDRISTTLARIRREHPGVRLPATGALFDQLVTATLEQKVTHDQARFSWRNLIRSYAEPAPSYSGLLAPQWLRLPLTGGQLRAVPSWEWHRLWVQPPLSRTVLQVAARARSIHRLGAATLAEVFALEDLQEQLVSIPGIGPWTVAEALQRSHGAADLPSVGDFHLSAFVGEALTGRRTDDAGMLQLLEPFRPHRHRVIRLLGLSGFRHQRFGAKLAPADYRDR